MSTLKDRRTSGTSSDNRYENNGTTYRKSVNWATDDSCEYYCITGANGLGIFTDRDAANTSSRYAMQSQYRIFHNLEDAMEWTISEYNSFQKNNPNGILWPEGSDVPLDWFYRSSRIREMFPFG